MFLKSLVLRGFKSFADKTELVFEPGIAIIVGPNGSGKTNIVDAISWVLGEQGPRSLRGGKMEDVIFAGSRQRPALGMAEVVLTIDNSSGIIPVEFTEFTVSRVLFRSGESEYRLNGAACRLLDIQEILSDTGIGREQHTIIGQGQLDEILQADPMQMRGFIEEAAGVAKHRRRRERALRKIGAAEQNVGRLTDLLAEIRRQLRPLRQQAEVARRHTALGEELGRLRLVAAARELAEIRSRYGSGGRAGLDGPIRDKERELTELEERLAQAEASRSERFADSERARDGAWGLSRQAERLAALHRLAGERERTLRAELAGATEAGAEARVEELRRELSDIEGMRAEAATAQARSDAEVEEKRVQASSAELTVQEADRALAPARGAHRESIAEAVRVRGEIGALEGSLSSAERELGHISSRHRVVLSTRDELEGKLHELRAELERLDSSSEPAEKALEDLDSEAATLAGRRADAERSLREAERNVAIWRARAEVRAAASATGSRRLASAGIGGVLGVLSDLVVAPSRYRAALDAVAGPAEQVLVVRDSAAAERVLSELKPGEKIGILVAGRSAPAPAGATRLSESVEIAAAEGREALGGLYLANSLADAARLANEHPDSIFVTAEGSVAAGRFVATGSADAAARAAEAGEELSRAEEALADIDAEVRANADRRESIAPQLNEADAAAAAAAERLATLDREAHAVELQVQAISEAEQAASVSVGSLSEELDSLRATLPTLETALEQGQLEIDRMREEHAAAAGVLQSAHAALEAARMEQAKTGERSRLLDERRGYLADALKEAVGSASGVEARRERIIASIEQTALIAATANELKRAAESWAADAEREYQSVRSEVAAIDSSIGLLRTERAGLAGALDDMRVRAREEQAGRSEWMFRSRLVEEKLREEWGIDPDRAVSSFGHVWEVEDESRITDPTERIALLDDEALRRKRLRVERDLADIGQVNPLAAQEFDALTERERFLAEQINDVRKSRRDLFKIVASIDEHIRQMFTDAFEDTSREYERLLAMLFPGGQGRLRLSDPQDLLQTGVEVEVRPGGKNLRRLSLLSGGEKALAALAMLFAIFRARPSPFYVLDEVEAALDDVNLHRFLSLLNDFRDTAQMLVVTHQKRTMEIADVLYGISIRPDGASRVISERMSRIARDVRGRIPSD